jgi:hypothetical protein
VKREEGILPTRRLYPRSSDCKRVNDPMDGSRVEVIKLFDKRTPMREVIVNREGGRLPGASGLLLMMSTCKRFKDPIVDGRADTIKLYDKSSHVRDVIVNREEGILPAIRLVLKDRYCKQVKEPIVEGIPPVRRLPPTDKYCKRANDPIPDGRVDMMELYFKSRIVRDDNVKGTVPTS